MPTGPCRRGPKPAHCPRAKRSDSSDRSSRSTSRSSSQSHVRFSNDNSSRSSSQQTNSAASSIVSRNSSVPNSFAPDMKIEIGDRQETYVLPDKGKLVIINKKNGDLQYMLRCVDGRTVYIEKTDEGAALLILNAKKQVIKALSGFY